MARTIDETRRGSCGKACAGGEVSAFTSEGGRRIVVRPFRTTVATDAEGPEAEGARMDEGVQGPK